jgi:hypothetical protein
MKCCNLVWNVWHSVFNSQGWRLVIVVVQLGVMKIYVVVVEELRKKER